MHEDCGYTFNGNSNISGLTPVELASLQLGFLVRQEQQQEQANAQQRGEKIRPQSTSSSYAGRKRAMKEKYIH